MDLYVKDGITSSISVVRAFINKLSNELMTKQLSSAQVGQDCQISPLFSINPIVFYCSMCVAVIGLLLCFIIYNYNTFDQTRYRSLADILMTFLAHFLQYFSIKYVR